MGDASYQRARAVFHEVCELEGVQRTARLSELCAGDADLRVRVERLLDAASSSASDPPPFVPSGDGCPAIDGYTLVRPIGAGGMGLVYEARQHTPDRRVAIKVLRGQGLIGEATRSLVSRFEREARALGRLTHPGIAQVYAVGVSGEGHAACPYIAMEYVDGVAIDEFTRVSGVSIEERVRLVAEIADAVDHAHSRGVIHRDLKPANIMVDQEGRPKILDFGIARLTDSDVKPVTMQTEAGQIIGTIASMSPEQASGDPSAIDERTDVYALGVLLFEMLTGRPPHETEGMPLPDAIRVIREQEPARVGTLDTRLRGDIETILGKALERDPRRRYGSARSLADELRRFLRHEPILARPPSAWYQVQKFARRNRAFVVGAGAVVLVLAVSVVVLGVALREESVARRQAEEALERAEAASAFLDQVLSGLSPVETQGRDTELLGAMLDRAADSARTEIDNPAVRSEMLGIVGRSLHAIYEYARAEDVLRESIELATEHRPDDAVEILAMRSLVAHSAHRRGEFEFAERLYGEVQAAAERSGDLAMVRQTLRHRSELAMDRGRFDEAVELAERALREVDRDDALELGQAELQLGASLRRLGRFEEAEARFRSALDAFTRAGAELQRSIAMNSLAIAARRTGDLRSAERWYTESIGIRERIDGRTNPDTAASLANLGRLYVAMNRLEAAEEVLVRSIAQHDELFGALYAHAAYPLVTLAEALTMLGRHAEATSAADRAVGLTGEGSELGRHPLAVLALRAQGDARLGAGDTSGAIESYERCVSLGESLGVDPDVYLLHAWAQLVRAARTTEEGDAESRAVRSIMALESAGSEDAGRVLEELGVR